MKKIIPKVALAVLISSCFAITPSYSHDVDAIVYEKALMKYVLAYEALQKAKLDPNKKSELPKYVRKYRESYAQYLELMRKNDLYNLQDEQFVNDPDGNFNSTMEERGMPQQKFEAFDTSSARQQISQKVKRGEDVDSAVECATTNSVPKKGYSQINYKLYGWDLDSDGYGEMPPKWKKHWPAPKNWKGGPRPPKPKDDDGKQTGGGGEGTFNPTDTEITKIQGKANDISKEGKKKGG